MKMGSALHLAELLRCAIAKSRVLQSDHDHFTFMTLMFTLGGVSEIRGVQWRT